MNLTHQKLIVHSAKIGALLIVLFFSGMYLIYGQTNSQTDSPEVLNFLTSGTSTFNLNINNRKGVYSQDIKRSAGMLVLKLPNPTPESTYQILNCNLLNNASQIKMPYIVTISLSEFLDLSNPKQEVYLSFNYEMPDNRRGAPGEKFSYYAKLFKTTVQVVYNNSHISLLKLVDYPKELLENVYAAGWNNTIGWENPTNAEHIHQVIGHPNGDNKKIFIKPKNSEIVIIDNVDNYFLGYLIESPWEGFESNNVRQVIVGSGAFSKQNQIVGITRTAEDFPFYFVVAFANIWNPRYGIRTFPGC